MKTKAIISALGLFAVAAVAPTLRADVIDLANPGDPDVITDQNVRYSTTAQQPTGTGVIDPFLRVDGNSGTTGVITEGYNTSAAQGNDPMDDKGGIYTHDVLLSSLGVVNGNYVFLLDANQTGDEPRLTMSQFILFTSDHPADGSFATLADLNAAFGPARYSMRLDTLSGSAITGLDLAVQNTNGFDANNGSGSGDLLVFIPTSLLAGDGNNLILYVEYGDGTYRENDGFEEWAFQTGPVSVPDNGATLAMLGIALAAIGLFQKYLPKPTT